MPFYYGIPDDAVLLCITECREVKDIYGTTGFWGATVKAHLIGPLYALLGSVVVTALSLGGVSPAAAAPKPASITSVGPEYDLDEAGISGSLVLGADDRTAYFPISGGFGTVDLQTKVRGASILSGTAGGKFVLSQDGKTIYAMNGQHT